MVLCPVIRGNNHIISPNHNNGGKVDFHSTYSCPVGIRRSAGNGIRGLCAMELLDVMTREEGDLSTKYRNITDDNPPSVDYILRTAVIEWNDDGSRQFTMNERADTIWPILPSILDTRRAFGNFVEGDTHEGFMDALDVEGFTIKCCENCPRIYQPSKVYSDERTGKTDSVKATEVLKRTIEIFYRVSGLTPTQTDFTPQQVENLREYMDLHIGKGYQRDFPVNNFGNPNFEVPYGDRELASVTAS